MPIPVAGSGNVDGEGGTPYCPLRYVTMDGIGWFPDVQQGRELREWLVAARLQSERAVRGTRAARALSMAQSGQSLLTTSLESVSSMAELTNDADDHGTDDA